MALGKVFRTARLWGDASSLARGYDEVGGRLVRRGAGRMSGKVQAGLSIHNLFIWAAFLGFVRDAVKLNAAEDTYVVNVMKYAAGYDLGFKQPKGRKKGAPGYQFFQKGIRDAFLPERMGPSSVPTGGRSGLYIGGRFAADIRSVWKGNLVDRIGRRAAGRQTSALFWGALRNPNYNMMQGIAERAVTLIRRNISEAGLVDTGALKMATQWGNSLSEAASKSRQAAMKRITMGSKAANESLAVMSAGDLIARKVG